MIETNIVSFISLSDAVNIVYKNISTTSNNFMSGIDTLDLLTNGWPPGELCVVGARPLMGKTEFVLSCISNMLFEA